MLNMTTRFKSMYENAKNNYISPTMIYVYDNVCYAIDNESIYKFNDEQIEKICEFVDSCIGHSDYISVYNLARYVIISINNGDSLEDIIKTSPSEFVESAIEYFA